MKSLRPVGISVLIALALYFALASGLDAAALQKAVMRIGWLGWGVILALSLVNYGLRFGRWHYYLQRLGHRVPIERDIVIYLAGFAMTTTPGKAGEALRSVYLRPWGVGYGHSLAALFTERFSDLAAIMVLSVLGLLSFGQYTVVLLAALGATLALLVVIQRPELVALLERRGAEASGWLSGICGRLVVPLHASARLLRPRPLYIGLLLGVIGWAAEGFALFLVAQTLDIEVGLALALGIYAVSMLVGALSFLPGGLGSTEAVMALLLAANGTTTSLAIAATLITRIATLWFAVGLGLCAFLALELSPVQSKPHPDRP